MTDWHCTRISVLIPSSSGHGFNDRRPLGGALAARLNPFFIRAWVQHRRHRARAPADRLNPFFIRAWVQRLPSMPWRGSIGLNPFFIRAWVQQQLADLDRRIEVLIPSSSGHGFNASAMRVGACSSVLIPSSSGHGFNLFNIALARAVKVLIPSSSGHGFNGSRQRTR